MTVDEILRYARARNAVERILRDLSDRGGLEEAWDSIDKHTQKDVKKAWVDIVFEETKE